jgi:hypothetical protein
MLYKNNFRSLRVYDIYFSKFWRGFDLCGITAATNIKPREEKEMIGFFYFVTENQPIKP